MGTKIKSLLDELSNMAPERDKYVVIESRAQHFITSGINLLKQIDETFTPEEADELSRRLFNSLKGRDVAKFERKIRQLRESKERKIEGIEVSGGRDD
jgi:hypothetical protein